MNLLYPMAVMMFYIFGLGVLNFLIRNNAVKKREMSVKYFRTFQATDDVPERIIRFGRHFDNQFQLPSFFFITCLTCLVLTYQPTFIVLSAWGFVATRLIHSSFHLGSNYIPYRAFAYLSGWVALLVMWTGLLLQGF